MLLLTFALKSIPIILKTIFYFLFNTNIGSRNCFYSSMLKFCSLLITLAWRPPWNLFINFQTFSIHNESYQLVYNTVITWLSI